MLVAREDLALEAAFWAQLPGNFPVRPRKAPITSRNFAAMAPFWKGTNKLVALIYIFPPYSSIFETPSYNQVWLGSSSPPSFSTIKFVADLVRNIS
jgi:hypothetical protein